MAAPTSRNAKSPSMTKIRRSHTSQYFAFCEQMPMLECQPPMKKRSLPQEALSNLKRGTANRGAERRKDTARHKAR